MVEHGAYRLLLDAYYTTGPLSENREKLYRICRAFAEDERAAINTILDRFFELRGCLYHNRKADRETEYREKYLSEQVRKSRLGVAGRRAKAEPTDEPEPNPRVYPRVDPAVNPPSPSPSPSLTPSPIPSPTPMVDIETSIIETNKLLRSKSAVEVETDFDRWYAQYPKKRGKKAALKAWQKAKDKPALKIMLTTLAQQAQSPDWTRERGQFIPHPATYLNQGRWDDDVGEPKQQQWSDVAMRTMRNMKDWVEEGNVQEVEVNVTKAIL